MDKFIRNYYQKYPGFKKFNDKQNASRLVETNRDQNVHQYEADNVSMVELSSAVQSAAANCEVCVYVIENKAQHQPYLCRGLKTPDQQQSVSLHFSKCFTGTVCRNKLFTACNYLFRGIRLNCTRRNHVLFDLHICIVVCFSASGNDVVAREPSILAKLWLRAEL